MSASSTLKACIQFRNLDLNDLAQTVDCAPSTLADFMNEAGTLPSDVMGRMATHFWGSAIAVDGDQLQITKKVVEGGDWNKPLPKPPSAKLVRKVAPKRNLYK
jgi:hypothetical protein